MTLLCWWSQLLEYRSAPLNFLVAHSWLIFKAQICIPRRPVFTTLGLQIQEAQCSLPEENKPQNTAFYK